MHGHLNVKIGVYKLTFKEYEQSRSLCSLVQKHASKFCSNLCISFNFHKHFEVQ